MIKESVTAHDVCVLLNEALTIDYDGLHALVSNRVDCNTALANHPTIQVQQFDKDKSAQVGLLGFLNGLFGIREDGMGAVCMVVDGTRIVEFKPTPDRPEGG